jgi:hypothetical protein
MALGLKVNGPRKILAFSHPNRHHWRLCQSQKPLHKPPPKQLQATLKKEKKQIAAAWIYLIVSITFQSFHFFVRTQFIAVLRQRKRKCGYLK